MKINRYVFSAVLGMFWGATIGYLVHNPWIVFGGPFVIGWNVDRIITFISKFK
jgi:uncharacterized membrane protein